MKQKVISFAKKEIVFIIAAILAILSCLFVKPSAEYLEYIDFRVLGILLTLMILMEGLSKNHFFDKVGEFLLARTRRFGHLCLVLVFLCFFFSMFITNDVALITFVPFSIMILKKINKQEHMIYLVVLQTLAANLGSMLTPIGNPQNLYLYQFGGFQLVEFLHVMMPYVIASGIFLLVSVLGIRNRQEEISFEQETILLSAQDWRKNRIYLLLFLCALLVVARIFPASIVLVATILIAITLDAKILRHVDYMLLLTFVAFFIFTGNMGKIEGIRLWLEQMVAGREVLAGILTSQVISNVPAALLLSGFSQDVKGLLIGVNLGGLGTLIASMASLISYKLFAGACPTEKGRYFLIFSGMNLLYLIGLLVLNFVG